MGKGVELWQTQGLLAINFVFISVLRYTQWQEQSNLIRSLSCILLWQTGCMFFFIANRDQCYSSFWFCYSVLFIFLILTSIFQVKFSDIFCLAYYETFYLTKMHRLKAPKKVFIYWVLICETMIVKFFLAVTSQTVNAARTIKLIP